MTDQEYDLPHIAAEIDVGYLGITTPDGYPRVVPVNFATIEDVIYFHGAASGEKYEAFRNGQRVTFCIAVPYSMIPSYWRSERYGCPATQYFKSVLVKGRGVVVEDPNEKARALQALMDKHQPEGGFAPFDYTDQLYRAAIDEVAIFRIKPERFDIKIKFGQNLTEPTRRKIIQKLQERGRALDLRTAEEMAKVNATLPNNGETA
jgi:hypothetical protein